MSTYSLGNGPICRKPCLTASAVPWYQAGLSGVCSAARISTNALLNALKWYVFFICLLSEAELNCVSTNMRPIPLFRQLEIGISTSLYFPAIGTAGFDLLAVSGNNREPAPPPSITDRISRECVIVRIDILF